jgi:hypothetical protein
MITCVSSISTVMILKPVIEHKLPVLVILCKTQLLSKTTNGVN